MKKCPDCGENAGKSSFERIISELKRSTKKESIKFVFSDEKGKGNSFLSGERKGDMIQLLLLDLGEVKYSRLPQSGSLELLISPDMSLKCSFHLGEKFEGRDIEDVVPDAASPVLKPAYISFEKAEDDFICVNDTAFPSALKSAVKAATGDDMNGDMYTYFTNDECERLCREFTGEGSKLFGNPCFLQDDPREDGEELFLQLDSDGEHIMFGDYGTANFFLDAGALDELDFSQTEYFWDSL